MKIVTDLHLDARDLQIIWMPVFQSVCKPYRRAKPDGSISYKESVSEVKLRED